MYVFAVEKYTLRAAARSTAHSLGVFMAAVLQPELMYHTHLNEAARLASQCAKLCRDVQQKMEFVKSGASALPEAWREMRAATQAAEDQLGEWMTHLG